MERKLVVSEGNLEGLELVLSGQEEWTLGNDPESSGLFVDDSALVPKELLLKSTDDGIIVESLNEEAPTLLNGKPLQAAALLHSGDILTVGTTTLAFQEENDDVEPESGSDEEPQEHDTIYEETSEEDRGILAEIDFDLTESGRFLLKVIHGPNNGAEFSMQKGTTYLIGTDPNTCDIVFHDTSVSRQHAKLVVNDDESMTVEDLSSKNGTIVDTNKISEKTLLSPNTLVTLGTTSFVIYDREGEMHTIISPMLPEIVKSLQKEREEEEERERLLREAPSEEEVKAHEEEKKQTALSAFVVTGILLGLFVIIGVSVLTLFREAPVKEERTYNIENELNQALAPFPDVKRSFNKTTGKLFLAGHVLTHSDKSQLDYNLQGLPFINSVDDSGVIIDEGVWKEANQILLRNPKWKGITIHATRPGQFVLTGYLQKRADANQLNDYITGIFPYPDMLEKNVVVEEDILSTVQAALNGAGIRNIDVRINNGELVLTGGVSQQKKEEFGKIAANFSKIPGVRSVKEYITEIAPEASLVNISDKYQVSGVSRQGGKVNVVINGRILTVGDYLDGMKISDIKPSFILLEKDNTQYRIDY